MDTPRFLESAVTSLFGIKHKVPIRRGVNEYGFNQ